MTDKELENLNDCCEQSAEKTPDFTDLFTGNQWEYFKSLLDKDKISAMNSIKQTNIDYFYSVLKNFYSEAKGWGNKKSDMDIHSLATSMQQIINGRYTDIINYMYDRVERLINFNRQTKFRLLEKENDLEMDRISFDLYIEKEKRKINKMKENFGDTDKFTKIKEDNISLSKENEMLKTLISQQTESIKGYKEQVSKLSDKLSAVAEKAVAKQDGTFTINNN